MGRWIYGNCSCLNLIAGICFWIVLEIMPCLFRFASLGICSGGGKHLFLLPFAVLAGFFSLNPAFFSGLSFIIPSESRQSISTFQSQQMSHLAGGRCHFLSPWIRIWRIYGLVWTYGTSIAKFIIPIIPIKNGTVLEDPPQLIETQRVRSALVKSLCLIVESQVRWPNFLTIYEILC